MSLPVSGEARLKSLYSYDILDTVFEATFSDMAEVARWIAGAPIGLILLADTTRQWFKFNEEHGVRDVTREWLQRTHAISDSQLKAVSGAPKNGRFSAKARGPGEPDIRFDARFPLSTPEGYDLGTLCVIDYRPRELSAGEHLALDALGRLISAALELRGTVAVVRRHGDEIMDGDASGRMASELLVKPVIHFWEHLSVLPRQFSLRTAAHLEPNEPALALVLKELDEQTAFVRTLSHVFKSIVENPNDPQLLEQPRDLIRQRFPLSDWAASAERTYVDTARRHADSEAAEAERLAEMARNRMPQVSPEAAYDVIVRLAALLFGTPFAGISLIHDEQHRFEASIGFEPGQTHGADGFSDLIREPDDILVVLDARADRRFQDDPLVAGSSRIRFFAGARLRSSTGHPLGALCVMSPQSRRHFSKESQAKLKVLAWLVSSQMELRRVLVDERLAAERHAAAAATAAAAAAAAVIVVPGKQVTTSNVNTEFLELMAQLASGELPQAEVMAISMKAWDERVRANILLGTCLRSLRQTLSVREYEKFTAKMDGFDL